MKAEPVDDFAALIEHCVRLIQLLRDPHPGLFTWQEQVQRRREAIWNYDSKEYAHD